MTRLLFLAAISAGALFLTACGGRLNEYRPAEALVRKPAPVIPAAVLAEPEGKTTLPEKLTVQQGFELWGEDRDRLDACVMVSAAKTMTIQALQER